MKIIKRLAIASIWLLASLSAQAQFENSTVAELGEMLDKGEATSGQLVEFYLRKIDAHNKILKAVTRVSPLALEEARRLDRLRAEDKLLGPLHGIPVLLKDNIDTADGLPNTAGSILLEDNLPQSDAFLVRQLKNAGAIILGKANLSEWANFRSTSSSSGWSGTGGQTRNPYDLSRSPCGSSAGSAVAVAAGLAPLAVGTETDGSVTCPAAINGVVGIKPTLGLVSRSGIIPISIHQDTAGPMAASVSGAVHLLDSMVGKDSADPFGKAPRGRYADSLQPGGLKGMRIGVVRNLMGYSGQTDAVFEQALETLKSQGAIIVDNADIETLDAIHEKEFDLLAWDFKDALNEYLAGASGDYKTLRALIEGNREKREQEMPHFGQEIFIKAQESRGRKEPDYEKEIARLKTLAGRDGIDATMEKHHVDILVAPSAGPAWKIDHINGDNYLGSASTPAAVAGYPHITVPMGFVKHLPVGISFFSGADREDILIRAAYNYEQASRKRRAPPVTSKRGPAGDSMVRKEQ